MPTWPAWMTDTRCLALIVVGMAVLAPQPARGLLTFAVGAGLFLDHLIHAPKAKGQ